MIDARGIHTSEKKVQAVKDVEKCSFFTESVKYLGRVIDARGIHTSEKKVQAVKDVPAPENLQ